MKKQMQTVSCPKSMVGRVIGKNGETIRALQNYSGALIQIDQSTDPMKVTISGTQESVRLAISMVTDIVNGTFKGFAMLRQVTNEQAKGDATVCQPVYAPGYGLIPPSQHGIAPSACVDASSIRMPQPTAANLAAAQFPGVLPSFMESQLKPQSLNPASLLTGNNAFDSLSLGMNGFPPTAAMSSTAASGCANLAPISSLEMLQSGGLSQPLTESVVSPACKTAALSAFGDLGLSLSESAVPSSLLDSSRLNLPSSFPMDFPTAGGLSSPLSGSISPELSCGWTTGIQTTGAFSSAPLGATSFAPDLNSNTLPPTDKDLVSNAQHISEFLKASSSGSSYSDISDTAENSNCSRLSPRSTNTNVNNNILCLMDPSGRPFTVDISTGETHWINDVSAGHGLLPFAAATMN